MDNLKNLEALIEQHINPNGTPGSILALNHQAILKQVLTTVGKWTGSAFVANKNATVFPSGTFSWNNNAMNNTSDFTITMSKKTADLNDVGIILETMVLGDVIQFKDFAGRSVFLTYKSHVPGTDTGGAPTYVVTVAGSVDNPNYIYQVAEQSIAVLSYHKKLVDATPAISTDADNTAILGTDGKIYVPSGGGRKTIENRFVDIPEMVTVQTNQTDGSIQFVNDASADPGVASGFAYYEYLGTTAGTLDDYRRLTDVEVADVMVTEISIQDDTNTEQFKMTDFVRFGNMVFDSALKKITPDFSNLVAKVTGKSLIADTEISRLANLNDRFKGKFTTLGALQSAVPTANAGDYAQVDTGGSDPVVNYNWDIEDGWVVGSTGGSGATTTDELPEGSANLYFDGARVLATILSGLSLATGGAIVSTDSVLIAFGKIQKQINDLTASVAGKQATLVSATNIKTINGSSVLGSGDLSLDFATPQEVIDGDAQSLVDAKNYSDNLHNVITVSSSRPLATTDHNKILMVTATVTLTIPSSGLQNHFNCDVDVLTTGIATFAGDGGAVVLDFPFGKILEANKMATIYRKGTANDYRGKGEFIV